MTEFRAVTEDFAVSPQIGPADIGAAASGIEARVERRYRPPSHARLVEALTDLFVRIDGIRRGVPTGSSG